jgi:hypothetical protein
MTTAPGISVSEPAAARSPNSYPDVLAVLVIAAAIGLAVLGDANLTLRAQVLPEAS